MSNDLAYAQLYDSCPLPPASRFIRLLHVHAPSNGIEHSPIESHLEIVSLGDKPSYAALSYVWGLSGSFQILCGAVNVPVTANCHSALWHLRKTLGAFCIWVDAICINQQNTPEKAQQIALMRNIFAMSNKVYIWTGAGTDATIRAMSYLASAGLSQYREIATNTQQNSKPQLKFWRAFCGYHRSRWSSTRTLVPEPNDTSGYKWSWKISPLRNWRIARGNVIVTNDDLEQLLSCAWTTRLWTYQEVISAVNPVVVNGTIHIPWPNFVSSCVLLSETTTLPSMGRWLEIIQSRAQMRGSLVWGSLQELYLEVSLIYTFLDRCAVVLSVVQLIAWVLVLSCIVVLLISWYLDPMLPRLGVYPVLLLVLILFSTAVLLWYWLPPNPPGAWWLPPVERDPDPGPFTDSLQSNVPLDALSSHPRWGLLNTLCWRTSSEPKDAVFALLPMIKLAFDRQPFRVDYSVDRSRLYTDLARLFINEGIRSHDGHDSGILALAAKARCPGAATWVPDFSQMLHPTLGRGYAPPTLRRADPVYKIDTANKDLIYAERVSWTLPRRFTIYSASDFVDSRRLGDRRPDLHEFGEIYNVKCMMYRMSAPRCHGVPFSDGTRPSKLSHNVLWPQVYQHQFPSSASNFSGEDFEAYNKVIWEAIIARAAPSKLLQTLKTSHRLFGLHHSICHSFATAQELFYVSNSLVGQREGPLGTSYEIFQHIGAVSGSQQGQIQVGDEIIGTGSQDHVAYRRAEERLIARLDPEDSFLIIRNRKELKVGQDMVEVHLK